MTDSSRASAAILRDLALSLAGTVEVPHFDRTAFKVRTIFATVPPDGNTANLRLTPDEQAHWCGLFPDAMAPVPNKWGQQGWTTVTLAAITPEDLGAVLRSAWRIGGGGAGTVGKASRRTSSPKLGG